MTVETATYIDELVPGNTDVGTDPTEGGQQIKLIKEVLQNTFPNISGAMNSTEAELNALASVTLGTAAASKVVSANSSAEVDASALTWTNLGTVTTGIFSSITMGGVSATTIKDEDDLGSDSASALPTQQSVKAYVDGKKSYVVLQAVLADVSTAETVLIPVGVAGTILRVDSVLEGAITTADATVTLKTSADDAIASLVITQSGSAAGDIDTDAAPTNATLTAGSYLKLATNGNSDTARKLWVSILVEVSTY